MCGGAGGGGIVCGGVGVEEKGDSGGYLQQLENGKRAGVHFLMFLAVHTAIFQTTCSLVPKPWFSLFSQNSLATQVQKLDLTSGTISALSKILQASNTEEAIL